jgi:SAM-dependent methyltransferase
MEHQTQAFSFGEAPTGKFSRRECCRGCGSPRIQSFLDFGRVPLAGDFRTPSEASHLRLYPMDLAFCADCSLVQIPNVVAPEVIFSDYRYLSSITQTLRSHFADYASEIAQLVGAPDGALVVDVGCNDGVLLDPLRQLGVNVVGVDAAENVVERTRKNGHTVYSGFFGAEIAERVRAAHGTARFINASNVFAHIDDLTSFLGGVKVLLDEDGYFGIEVHYVRDLLEGTQFDTVYHEHLCYYSLKSLAILLEKNGLCMDAVSRRGMHGGAIRVIARPITASRTTHHEAVVSLIAEELRGGLHSIATYERFGSDARSRMRKLTIEVEQLVSDGRKICAYGAAGRATILLNVCELSTNSIQFVADESPSRIGRLVPNVGIPIVSHDEFERQQFDYCLISAWNYADEIMRKTRDKMRRENAKWIIPLPHFSVVSP